ncbi:MAG: tetratricopeptide repeat protein [Nitrospirae bacterium]|nr:tetratricopeptide repeat protein [Nitrospirota bacterium]
MFYSSNSKIKISALFAALITMLVYLPALQNNFINWDDHDYVYNNPNIRSIGIDFFKWIFTSFHASNWHPLTWISHALDYAIWGLDPMGHHLTSIILHGLNTFLVVLLTIGLINYIKDIKQPRAVDKDSPHLNDASIIAGVVTGLLFGLHPLHVESVAWISERKDVLCAFFYLLSILSYLKYACHDLNEKKYLYYSWSLLSFIMALMSKPMAVTLPVILIILDIYPFERLNITSPSKSHRKVLAEKLPFFGFSLASTALTVMAQQGGGAISSLEAHPVWDRILLAFNSLWFYLYKMVWPSNLVPFYPYPSKISILSLPYMGAVIFTVFISVICVLSRKKQKVFSAAWTYYVVTLLPVLGLVQAGNQAGADRYTYLPCIGPLFLTGLGTSWLWEKTKDSRDNLIFGRVAIAGFCIIVFALSSVLTIRQTGIWKNTLSLWKAELEVYPDDPHTLASMGMAYYSLGDFDKALEYFNASIETDKKIENAFYHRGLISLLKGDFNQALSDFNSTIDLNSENAEARRNMVLAYKLAIKFYSEAIEKNPGSVDSYINRGVSYVKTGETDKALEDFNKVISITPLAAVYYNRGLVYDMMGEHERAAGDFKTAAGMGYKKAQ